MNLDGSDKKEIPTGVDLNASPSLSPDGSQIAFAGLGQGQHATSTRCRVGGGNRPPADDDPRARGLARPGRRRAARSSTPRT